jgi:hypothetical protein
MSDENANPPRTAPDPRERDGRMALSGHVADKATAARLRYGQSIDSEAIARMLADREVVRYPAAVVFDEAPLEPGEFAYARPFGDHPAEGFQLVVHPCFRDRPETWPLLIAYHIPTINYGDIATSEDCELYGATLLGMDRDEYYRRLCTLADEVPPPGLG